MRSRRSSFVLLAALAFTACRTAPPPPASQAASQTPAGAPAPRHLKASGVAPLDPGTPQDVPVTIAPAGPEEIHYGFLFSGNRAGSASSRRDADGTLTDSFEFNDRGRGSNTTSTYRLDARGVPVSLHTTGNDYWKNPVDETFAWNDGRATWKSASEKGERELREPAFFLSLNGPPQENELLARALLA